MSKKIKRNKRDIAAEVLKSYRMRNEWTLEQMAEKTGLHYSTISKLENGITRPSDLTIARLENRIPDLFEAA